MFARGLPDAWSFTPYMSYIILYNFQEKNYRGLIFDFKLKTTHFFLLHAMLDFKDECFLIYSFFFSFVC